MRTRDVRLTASAFTLLFLAAALGAAWRESRGAHEPEATPLDGAEAFERSCARCHAADDFAEALRADRDGSVERAWVEFLAAHGDASDAQDRAIVAYLTALAR